ncbi:MAG: asparagine synthase (glutamine-hydrolyzing) [Candidatus Omnitrophota bacterium]
MCGIAGIVCKKEKFDLETQIKEMASILKNRGPDGEGFLLDKSEGVYLGHRRLSIIDLSERANQPLFNEDKSLALVFNGEIYNYIELRDELIAGGHKFISSTDSEVLLHGWEEWGLSLFEKINGMFAFCIYDRVKKEMILARDNIGIKPLYYLDSPGIFAFASESRAFYPLRGRFWKPGINDNILRQMLLFQYVIDKEETLYAQVKKLPAGHYLYYKEDAAEVKPYWTVRVNPGYSRLKFEEAVRECDEQFNRSIKWQLRSDVPVGILLSGGLDSSLVTAVATRHARQVNTFTATFDHKLDERSYAKRCSEYLGTNHAEFNIDPLSINNRIEEIIKYYDDLSSFDGGVFTIYLMAEKIREFNIKVLLVGEGSDELFGGYSWFGLSQAPFRYMPGILRSAAYHYAVSRQFSGWKNIKHSLYMHKIISAFREKDIFRQVSRFEIEHQLPNHFLMKVDHGTMAHSLEARVPYLDKELVGLAFSLPGEFKLKGSFFNFNKNNEKFILREVARKYLPPDIYGRKKRGFSIPIELVLKSNRDKVRDYLISSGSIARTFYSHKEIDGLFTFKNRLYSPVHKQKEFILWRLFLLDVWKRNYLN